MRFAPLTFDTDDGERPWPLGLEIGDSGSVFMLGTLLKGSSDPPDVADVEICGHAII